MRKMAANCAHNVCKIVHNSNVPSPNATIPIGTIEKMDAERVKVAQRYVIHCRQRQPNAHPFDATIRFGNIMLMDVQFVECVNKSVQSQLVYSDFVQILKRKMELMAVRSVQNAWIQL